MGGGGSGVVCFRPDTKSGREGLLSASGTDTKSGRGAGGGGVLYASGI